MRIKIDKPTPFLEVRVKDASLDPSLMAVCAGYECGEWRERQLCKHIVKWLPEFALKYSEYSTISGANAVEKIINAAKSIYETEKFKSRGEFGEILLHIILRQEFNTFPAISKYYFKDSRNETVKGFDAVHVVKKNGSLELWLGEVKFYKEISGAISAVIQELEEHTSRNYLRDEFIAITNKLDSSWPLAEEFKELISQNRSLDQIFDDICIPVMLSYDSNVINDHNRVTDEFITKLEAEVKINYTRFCDRNPLKTLKVHLILFPLKSKEDFQISLNETLKKWQNLDD